MNHRKHTIREDAQPFKLDGVYCRLIPIGLGYHVIVDAADYEWLTQYHWTIKRNRDGKVYAVRKGLLSEGWRNCQIPMHRFILGLVPKDGKIGDHRDSWNTLNNSRKNLRVTNLFGNAQNAERRTDNRTGVKGIQKRPNGTYRIRVWVKGTRVTVGHKSDLGEAQKIRDWFIQQHHGEFARTA